MLVTMVAEPAAGQAGRQQGEEDAGEQAVHQG